MSGPAQHGVLIYANAVQPLAAFYQQLFHMTVVRQTSDFICLDKDGLSLIIHSPPFELLPPCFSPLKLFLSVDDMATTRQQALTLGGQTLDGEWANALFKVSNIADPDGNQIQIRQFFNKKMPGE